jgi:hypothetical protein
MSKCTPGYTDFSGRSTATHTHRDGAAAWVTFLPLSLVNASFFCPVAGYIGVLHRTFPGADAKLPLTAEESAASAVVRDDAPAADNTEPLIWSLFAFM